MSSIDRYTKFISEQARKIRGDYNNQEDKNNTSSDELLVELSDKTLSSYLEKSYERSHNSRWGGPADKRKDVLNKDSLARSKRTGLAMPKFGGKHSETVKAKVLAKPFNTQHAADIKARRDAFKANEKKEAEERKAAKPASNKKQDPMEKKGFTHVHTTPEGHHIYAHEESDHGESLHYAVKHPAVNGKSKITYHSVEHGGEQVTSKQLNTKQDWHNVDKLHPSVKKFIHKDIKDEVND